MAKKKGKKGCKLLAALVICAFVCSFATSAMAVYEFIPGSTDLSGTIGKDGKSWQKLFIGNQIWFEGATSNTYETLFYITEPTADRVITFPNSSGTVSLTSGGVVAASTVDSAAIVDGTIRAQDIATGMINATLLKDGGITYADLAASIVNTTIIKDGSVAEVDLTSSACTANTSLWNTVTLAVSATSMYNTATYESGAELTGVYPAVATGLLNSMVNTVSWTKATGAFKITVPGNDTTYRKYTLRFLRP